MKQALLRAIESWTSVNDLFVGAARGHALSTYAKRGRGGVLPLRTPLHKCDVTYVVSPAYKGGEGVKKS